MAFTLSQLQAIKAAIVADPVLNAFPNHSDGNFAIADLLNAPSNPAVMFWDTRASVQALLNAIDFSKYTQTDAIDSTVLQTNRLIAVQTKQMNIQNMTLGRESLDMSKATTRASLRDAVIQISSGTSGGLVTAAGTSGANLMNAGLRVGTRLEAILASGTAQTGGVTASLFGYEGSINYQEVGQARNS